MKTITLNQLQLVGFIFLNLLLYSCADIKPSNDLEELKRLNYKFVTTQDSKYLDDAYSLIKISKIDDRNSEIIVTTLMYLKKYNELDSILESFDTKDSLISERKIFTQNVVKHLKRENPYNFNFIEENINNASERINLDQSDSLAYLNLFISLIYKEGKEKTLQHIDTLEVYNKNFTSLFYNHILRETIKEYPEEFYNAPPKAQTHKIPLFTSE
jgi:hypothetical protein